MKASRSETKVAGILHTPQALPYRQEVYQTLTERECEILELSGTALSVKGVANRLGIASGTVTWHLKNVYQKLGVSSREDALQKARDLRLIGGSQTCQVCTCWRLQDAVAALLPSPAANN